MAKRLLDNEPVFGATWFDYDHNEKKIYVGQFADVEPLLERNRAMQRDTARSDRGIKEGWMHAMSIPHAAIPLIEKKHGMKRGSFLRMTGDEMIKLIGNDSEFEYFKTTDKKL